MGMVDNHTTNNPAVSNEKSAVCITDSNTHEYLRIYVVFNCNITRFASAGNSLKFKLV